MAITADEVRNYPLSTDRRGYNIDEVDQLLETVAQSIDELTSVINNQARQLESRPAAPVADNKVNDAVVAEKVSRVRADYERQVAQLKAEYAGKDARISALEKEVEEAQANGNAIAQALIIAQRSADEILTNANTQATQIIDDAKDDASNILARAEEDKQGVLEEINTLNVEREGARAAYQDMLKDFIADATTKLSTLADGAIPLSKPAAKEEAPAQTKAASKAQIPVRQVSADTYVTPQTGNVVPVAATPTPSKTSKDLSGFGDAASDFSFGDVD